MQHCDSYASTALNADSTRRGLLLHRRVVMSWHYDHRSAACLRTRSRVQAFPSGALAFYNSGPASGASQPHKHVQVVPLPLGEDSSNRLPFAAVIQEAYQAAHAAPLAAFPLGDLPFQCWAAVLPDRCPSTFIDQEPTCCIWTFMCSCVSPLGNAHHGRLPALQASIGRAGWVGWHAWV